MKTLNEIKANKKSVDLWAIGDNGRQYIAAYNADLDIIFYCIPSSVEIIGYIERGASK